jgi:hypothetical protein
MSSWDIARLHFISMRVSVVGEKIMVDPNIPENC